MEETIFDQEFFAKLNRLAIAMRGKMTYGMSGGRKSTAKGSSIEFSDYREYIPGDDVRRIDWGAYGRLERLYIKQFMEEKEGIYQIFIDTSTSMEYGEPSKAKTARQVAGALAYLVLNNLDRVYVNQMEEGSLVQGKGLAGRQAFYRIKEELEQLTFKGQTNLNASIMARPFRGSGVSIIISDFFDHKDIEEGIKYLRYRKQQVVLIQILAPQEIEIEGEGIVNLLDIETGEEVRLSLNRSSIVQYEAALKGLQGHLQELAKKYEATYISLRSDAPIDRFLFDEVCNQGIIVRK